MSPARKPLAVAVTSIATLSLASSAQAGAAGGAQAPSAPLAGGSEYGLASATARHPVVTALGVPSTATPGRPPRVTLRLDEAQVATVNVTVAVNDLSTRHAAVVAALGWVHTGRTLAVRWPRGATLRAGTYHVSVSAHDHQRHSLTRSAHSSGVSTLTVAAPAAAPAPAPAPPVAAVQPGVPSPAQTVAAGAVFPVAGLHSFGGPESRYGAPRGGHMHEGQDILVAEGTPDVAPLAGTITSTSYQASGAGYYAVEHTLVGFDLMFAHCKAATLAVGTGQAVAAGQTLCLAGQSGDATAPHLHFEMWVGGWYAPGGHTIDPLPYLEAWEHPA
jgi:murein DD-endopeptidase MepM/ murein hydrolase activator NlpD